VALISGQLGADGLLTDWFNPSVASDAAKTPQLNKKQALIRKSVNGLDFRGVRCLRIVYGLVSIRKPGSLEVLFYNAEARREMGLTRAQQRSFDFAQDFACGFPLG